mgnify:CR=1 FL=1
MEGGDELGRKHVGIGRRRGEIDGDGHDRSGSGDAGEAAPEGYRIPQADASAGGAEQATGLNEVNAAVNQMDQTVQQNAAMVEQSTAATHSLKGETGELVRLMARFQVGNGTSNYTRPAMADAAQHAPARNPVAEQQARLNTFARPGRSSGSAAVAQAPATDGWEEF